jgi:mono/diheme cytochrome c family protein
MLTMNRWKVPDATATIKTTADSNKARGVQTVANAVLNPTPVAGGGGGGRGGGGIALTPEQQNLVERGGQIYQELCFACHGNDGFGTPRPESNSTMGPALAGSPRVNGHRDYIINAVLHGLSGPIDNKSFTEVMLPMESNKDEWIAAVASYVRSSFGNTAGFVTPADVARVRAATAARKTPWTIDELQASLPVALVNDGWKLTASHNPSGAPIAITLNPWTSGAPQQAGMWLQVELAQPANVTEIQFESVAGGGRGGGGGRGRGTPGTPGAPGTLAQGPGPGEAAPPIDPATVGYPRGYRVEVSTDGAAWRQVAEGAGQSPVTSIVRAGTFVRILGRSVENAPAWSIGTTSCWGEGRTIRTASPKPCGVV